jgi:hypothetical protein
LKKKNSRRIGDYDGCSSKSDVGDIGIYPAKLEANVAAAAKA